MCFLQRCSSGEPYELQVGSGCLLDGPLWPTSAFGGLCGARCAFVCCVSLLVSDRNQTSPVMHSATAKARSLSQVSAAIWPQQSHQSLNRQLWFGEINIGSNGMIPWCHFATQHDQRLPLGASSWTVRTTKPLWRRRLRSELKVNNDLPRQRSDLQMSPMCLWKQQNKVVKGCTDVCILC